MSGALLPDLWHLIFTWLGPCSLLNCAQVCKVWRECAHDERLWLRHHLRVLSQLGPYALDPPGPFPNATWNKFRFNLLQQWPRWQAIDASLCSMPEGWKFGYQHHEQQHRYKVKFTWRLPHSDGVMYWVTDEIPPGHEPCLKIIYMSESWKLQINGHVNPRALRRFYTIVRDSDCRGVREDCLWLTVIPRN